MPSPPPDAVPPLLAGLVDDAAALPPGNDAVPDAVAWHRRHLDAWYAPLVGPLLLPASALDQVPDLDVPRFGVVGDTGLDGVAAALAAAERLPGMVRFEVAVAKRGEDPAPGLRALLTEAAAHPAVEVHAEVPLTWGLMAALDTLAAARAEGARVAAKFRTGGLAAELFPTPVELAALICACRDRDLPFKLTAGLHRALRHTDPETGFAHHGFLNVLVAVLTAADGGEVAQVAEVLAVTDAVPLIEGVRGRRDRPRPLWLSFASGGVCEPLADLVSLGLLSGPLPREATLERPR